MRVSIPDSISGALGQIAFAVIVSLGTACTRVVPPSGTWVGYRPLGSYQSSDPVINAQLSTVKLVIKPNREAVLFDGGVPLAGEIEASENQLTLSYSNVAGVEQKQGSPAKRVSFQWTKDGNLRLDGLTLVRKSDSPN